MGKKKAKPDPAVVRAIQRHDLAKARLLIAAARLRRAARAWDRALTREARAGAAIARAEARADARADAPAKPAKPATGPQPSANGPTADREGTSDV